MRAATNRRTDLMRLRALITGALLAAGAAAALAANPPSASPIEPNQTTRGKMAVIHEQMAACLRSTKSIYECRREMMRRCRKTLGSSYCSRRGGRMGPGMGMGMGGGMMQSPPSPPEQ
ncbi:MAG: hypothetical protein ACREVO_00870 [Steroidobacteraceae bacterium]